MWLENEWNEYEAHTIHFLYIHTSSILRKHKKREDNIHFEWMMLMNDMQINLRGCVCLRACELVWHSWWNAYLTCHVHKYILKNVKIFHLITIMQCDEYITPKTSEFSEFQCKISTPDMDQLSNDFSFCFLAH